VNEFGQLPAAIESTPNTVIAPLQLSFAVSEIIEGTSLLQVAVIEAGARGTTGARVSFTVIVCDTDDVLLHASVNVQVLVTVNEFGQLPAAIESTPNTVIAPLQLSFAVSEIIAGTSLAQATFRVAGA
jgi:hypothetical protein